MLEQDITFWLIGTLCGSLMAILMATREHRWLRRPLVVILSAVIGAWMASYAAKTSDVAGYPAVIRAAGAAWCYPWAWLFLLNLWRRHAIAIRIFHLPILSLWLAPIGVFVTTLILIFYRSSSFSWTIWLLASTSLGVLAGQAWLRLNMLGHPVVKDVAQMRRFQRALVYPTIDGSALASEDRPTRKLPNLGSRKKAAPGEHGFIDLGLDSKSVSSEN